MPHPAIISFRKKRKIKENIMKSVISTAAIALLCIISTANAANILFLAGKPSHAKGEHEFHDGCNLLADAMKKAGHQTKVIYDKWPPATAFNGFDAIVIYCDGDKRHIARGHEKELQKISDSGIGVIALHYAVDGEPGILDDTLMNVIGGYYREGKSKNPTWVTKDMQLARHPTTSGIQPFSMKDEWYYNLEFGKITPIMTATPPNDNGRRQTLAWVYTTQKGSRGAGFTGGHYHKNWRNSNNRRLTLNLIAWTAGINIPAGGIPSENPVILANKNIVQAVARGDCVDLKNHISLGANVNQTNKQGWTPLHYAAVRGKTNCAEILLKNGAKVDPLTSAQKTPLHYAADRGFAPLIKLLLKNGANPNLRDNEGWTPLHYAAEKDRVECAEILLDNGTKVNTLSRLGGTPLHEAAASASTTMIKLLLKNGADKNIRADNGKTALDYAVELKNTPVAKILQ
jgi:hypothetical protein